MEMVLRRTEKGFRGRVDNFNVWLANDVPVDPGVHILSGDFMIVGRVRSSRDNQKGATVALIIKPVTDADVLYAHSGFINSGSMCTTTATTIPDGKIMTPGKILDLIYEADMHSADFYRASVYVEVGHPRPPVIEGKVYASMHKGMLRAYGLPDVRYLREVAGKSLPVIRYAEASKAWFARRGKKADTKRAESRFAK